MDVRVGYMRRTTSIPSPYCRNKTRNLHHVITDGEFVFILQTHVAPL